MLFRNQAAVLILLGLAVFASVVLRPAASMPWVPDWLGAAIAGVALLGTLMLFWRRGTLRVCYLLLFAVALALAAVVGALQRTN